MCRGCRRGWSYAKLVAGQRLDQGVDLLNPPAGAWRRDEAGETVIGATYYSRGKFMTMLARAAVWNGLVFMFLREALDWTLGRSGIGKAGFLSASTVHADGAHGWGFAVL